MWRSLCDRTIQRASTIIIPTRTKQKTSDLCEVVAASITPYGMFAASGQCGLSMPSLVAERAGAVARELLVSLLRPGAEGSAVRHAWTSLRAEHGQGAGATPATTFHWAENLLAGHGLFLRDCRDSHVSLAGG